MRHALPARAVAQAAVEPERNPHDVLAVGADIPSGIDGDRGGDSDEPALLAGEIDGLVQRLLHAGGDKALHRRKLLLLDVGSDSEALVVEEEPY